jgi:hypothetical protein
MAQSHRCAHTPKSDAHPCPTAGGTLGPDATLADYDDSLPEHYEYISGLTRGPCAEAINRHDSPRAEHG